MVVGECGDACLCCAVAVARRRFTEFDARDRHTLSINSYESIAHRILHSNRTPCANALENTVVRIDNFFFFGRLSRQTNAHAVPGGERGITHQSKCLHHYRWLLSTYFRHTQNRIQFYRHCPVDGGSMQHQKLKHAKGSFSVVDL